jgi:hypothetical protein
MAAYITTDDDLVGSGYITEATKRRLTPPEWNVGQAAGPWQMWHTEAWSETKRHLLSRVDPIEESDLTDSSELAPAVMQYVLYLAWLHGGDQERAKHHHNRYREMLNSIKLTLSTHAETVGWGSGIPIYRG